MADELQEPYSDFENTHPPKTILRNNSPPKRDVNVRFRISKENYRDRIAGSPNGVQDTTDTIQESSIICADACYETGLRGMGKMRFNEDELLLGERELSKSVTTHPNGANNIVDMNCNGSDDFLLGDTITNTQTMPNITNGTMNGAHRQQDRMDSTSVLGRNRIVRNPGVVKEQLYAHKDLTVQSAAPGSDGGLGVLVRDVHSGRGIKNGSKKTSPVPEDIDSDPGKVGGPTVAFGEDSVAGHQEFGNDDVNHNVADKHKRDFPTNETLSIECDNTDVLADKATGHDDKQNGALSRQDEAFVNNRRRSSLTRRHTCSHFGETSEVPAKVKRCRSQSALSGISSRAMIALKLRNKIRRKRTESQSSGGSSDGETDNESKSEELNSVDTVGESDNEAYEDDHEEESDADDDVNLSTASVETKVHLHEEVKPKPTEIVERKTRVAVYQRKQNPVPGDRNYDVFTNLPRIKKRSKKENAQEQMANCIFKMADVDEDGVLSDEEFDLIFRSPTLALDFSPEEMKKVRKAVHKYKRDPKDVTLHFREFKEFSKELLKLIYGKSEDNKGRWVELEGDNSGIIYFDKSTGEASYNVPDDYNIQIETDIFGDAIFCLLEQQDKKKTGQVTAKAFRQLLESITFSLRLSQEDVKHIRRLFKNDRLKMMYEEFVPIAKRMVLLIHRARDPSPFDWCMLVTPCVGTFWFNKKSGEARRFPPHSVIRGQQHQLEDREKERQSFLTKVEELKKAKKEAEQEKKQRETFEEELTKLKTKHDEISNQLERTTVQLEKSKFDLRKKAEKCEQQEKELTHALERMRNLEIKSSDLEKAELTLEATRRILDSTQGRLKMKEVELRTINSNFDDASKNLTLAESKIEKLEIKVDDLKVQVKEELRRNESIEKDLHSIPEMRESIFIKDKLIAQLKEELEQKVALLQLARKSARDHRDKIRVLERELLSLPHLKEEMEFSHCENMTLKKLLVGKDTLVVQKTQALSLAKDVISEIECTGQLVEKLETAISKSTVQATYPQGRGVELNGQLIEDFPNGISDPFYRSQTQGPVKIPKSNDRIDVNTPPYTTNSMDLIEYHAFPPHNQNNMSQGRLFKTILNGDVTNGEDERLQCRTEFTPRTNSAVHLHAETREKEGLERPKTATPRLTKQMGTFHDFRQNAHKNGIALRNGTSRQSLSDYGTGSSSASENKLTVKVMLSRLSKYEKDKLAAEFVHVGDRIMVRLGKKKENGPLTCGVVKFVGRVDKEYASYRLYVGLKLDTPIGDTDGVFKGKRYFQTPHRHGKLVKLSQVISVLNLKKQSETDQETINGDRVTTMRDFCETLDKKESQRSLPRNFKHIIFNDKHKVILCYIHKIASTNLRRLFLGLADVEDAFSVPKNDIYYKKGEFFWQLKNMSLTNLSPKEIAHRLETYTKFVVVRDPVERILSAYRQKLGKDGKNFYFKNFGRSILQKYHPDLPQKVISSGRGVTFEDFVRYLVYPKDFPDLRHAEKHWRLYLDYCMPCSIRYDVVAKYETLDDDIQFLLNKINAPNIVWPKREQHYKTPPSADVLDEAYNDIPSKELKALETLYYDDFKLFGYRFLSRGRDNVLEQFIKDGECHIYAEWLTIILYCCLVGNAVSLSNKYDEVEESVEKLLLNDRGPFRYQ